MPRPPRIQAPGLTYHVTSRGNRRERIFERDMDRHRFLRLFDHVVARYEWTCHAYCLMSTHYHLVITTRHGNIARGMQRLNSMYAQYVNHQQGFTGHVFQGRYHSVVVETESHLLELFRYVALNPVRAGRCALPEDWPWSSYRYALGLERPPKFLSLDLLHGSLGLRPGRAAAQLRSFVLDRAA